jgi:DNA polymerase III subunit delta'
MLGEEHTAILRRLTNAYKTDRLGHALLLTGGGGHGAYVLAFHLAQVLLGCDGGDVFESPLDSRVAGITHPDMLLVPPLPPQSERSRLVKNGIDPVMRSLQEDLLAPLEIGANWGITADQAREMIRWVSLTPWDAPGKVVILAEADRVTEPTADIMLKTLEEPPANVTLIVVTSRPQDLLPTVISRCQEVHAPPLPDEALARILSERGMDAREVAGVLSMASGDLWNAWTLLQSDAGTVRALAGHLVLTALNPKLGTARVISTVRTETAGFATADMAELVRWIIWCLRDLLLANESAGPIREDMQEALPLAKQLGAERITNWVEQADAAFEMLGRNVTPQAVVIALLIYPRDQRRLGVGPTFPPLVPALPR